VDPQWSGPNRDGVPLRFDHFDAGRICGRTGCDSSKGNPDQRWGSS
jgi:hypothetical protein